MLAPREGEERSDVGHDSPLIESPHRASNYLQSKGELAT